MSISPSEVSAVLVTRGDVDLTPVLESLIFENVIVYDNSREPDAATYGRALGAMEADSPYIYSQDDDIIHTAANQRAIVAAFDPEFLTGCMWHEWSLGAYQQGIEGGYDDLVFPGSGSIVHRKVTQEAIAAYLEHNPLDAFFRLWCDTIVGVIAPTKQLDIRFDTLPCAQDENRMCNLENAVELKTEAIMRARAIRDLVAA